VIIDHWVTKTELIRLKVYVYLRLLCKKGIRDACSTTDGYHRLSVSICFICPALFLSISMSFYEHRSALIPSVYMTVSISVERYVAIFFPLVYKARSQGRSCGGSSLSWHIIPVLLVSILVNIPTFFSSQVDYWTEEHYNYDYMQQMNATMPSLNSTLIGVTAVRKHPIYSFYYQNLTRFALLGLLPMLLLIILNVRVFSAIQARKSTCRDASYAHILLLVVLVFLLCQSPRLFLNFWELFLDLECGPPVWYQMLHVISNWLIALNSATNFFIYCLAGAKFRQGLAVMLGCRSPTPIGPPSTSHTAVDLKSYTTRL